jgi:hypothetical protein
MSSARRPASGSTLVASAQPDDLVVYCPDQLGPAVHRLLPDRFEEVTYPAFAGPAFVNWVDYQKRLDATDPAAFATEVGRRAGDRTIWLVTGPGYPNHHGACERCRTSSAKRAVTQVVSPNDDYGNPVSRVQAAEAVRSAACEGMVGRVRDVFGIVLVPYIISPRS